MAEELERPDGGDDQAIPITLQPDYRTSFHTFYSNFATISHTPDDLSIDFCLTAPPHNVDLKANILPVPVVARIIVPPAMAEGLIKALRNQLDKQLQEREEDRRIIVGRKKEADADA